MTFAPAIRVRGSALRSMIARRATDLSNKQWVSG